MRALAWIAYLLFGIFLLAALVAFLDYAQIVYDETLLQRAAAATTSPNVVFDGVGVITFYKQSDGPKPWLVYEMPGPTVATRSLTCGSACPGSFSALVRAYGSSQVRVTGTAVDEHVVVKRISSPTVYDDRIQFLSAKVGEAGDASGVTITPRIVGGEADDAMLWADVEHDGMTEQIFFKQGTLVGVGPRKVTLLYENGGTYYFAVLLD